MMNALFLDAAPALQRIVQALCWMLLHSLWQGLLLTIVAGIVMLLTKKASAATRYVFIAVLFFVFLVVCGWTFVYEWNSVASATADSLITRFSVATVLQGYGISHLPALLAQYCSEHALLIVATWFAVFSFRCWQMGRALLYIRHIRINQYQAPGDYWTDKVNALARQLHIHKTVLLLESGVTKVPVVIGHLKPVIYMPLGLLANLPPEQVEAVLLHELAHIRRHDFIINLLQNIAVTVFFFNPGLLWVSALLKQEREHCCDDVALGQTRQKKQFIEALISFKEHALYGSAYATAFPGTKNQLLQRVTRIIQNRNNSLSAAEKVFFVVSLLVLGVFLSTLGYKKNPVATASPLKEIHTMVSTDVLVDSVPGKERVILSRNRTNVTKKKDIIKTPAAITAVNTAAEISKEEPLVYPQTMASNLVYPAMPPPVEILNYPVERKAASLTDQQQAELDRQQAVRDRQQAQQDREQAVRDREQADRDRVQADKDRAQAELDRKQADRDRLQAIKDREQAERDRKQAERDKAHAVSSAS